MKQFCIIGFVGSFLLAGCASNQPVQSIQAVDRSIVDRTQAADLKSGNNGKPKVAAVDHGSIDRTFYSTCYDALLKCGYSKAEADATSKEYVTHSAVWNSEIDRMRYVGAAPLSLQPDAAMWETVRDHCQPNRTDFLTYPKAAAVLKSMARPQDRILVNNILATAAMNSGRYAEAKVFLDDTVACLGGINANDKTARKARSVFYAEDSKNFRGEPFERVMAYYYRGILYWMDGDLQNARACFRSGQFEDSDVENHEYANDYVLLDYLDGLITTKLLADGSDAFKRASTISGTNVIKLLNPPPYTPKANVQLFVEFGKGPKKTAEGQFHEMLKIQPSRSGAVAAVVKIEDQTFRLAPYDDLAYQATTRGGRVMDHIMKNKVVFKTTSKDVGKVLLVAAVAAASQKDGGPAAAVLLILGGAAYGMSYLANPACDIRAWWNLPQYLAFVSLSLPAGDYHVSVQFLDKKDVPIGCLDRTFRIKVNDQTKDTIVFISDKEI